MRKPVITVVGRPNVGKSTIFNRIIQRREAIVEDMPGVTRDRKYATADWAGIEFVLIDTGGYFPGIEDKIGKEVLKQVDVSIEEADVVVYLTDGRAGITALDLEIARILKRFKKPLLLGVNKVDNPDLDFEVHEFYKLGLGVPQRLSAENGRGVGDFLDSMIDLIPENLRYPEQMDDDDDRLQIAIVGKPNVGKSSYVNAVIGKERQIVTDIPGTTRDTNDTVVKYNGKEIVLVDTAGMRRKAKVTENVEFYSTVRSHDAIRKCDVAVVLIDAAEGVTDQDLRIMIEVVRMNKGIILAINKWDLVEKDANTAKFFEKEIAENHPNLSYIPCMFISALNRQRIFKILELAQGVAESRQQKIKTSVLNGFLREIIEKYPPPSMDKKEVKINYITQVKEGPPVFALFANHPKSIRANYRQYIENQFRIRFPFAGVPLTFVFKKKSNNPYD